MIMLIMYIKLLPILDTMQACFLWLVIVCIHPHLTLLVCFSYSNHGFLADPFFTSSPSFTIDRWIFVFMLLKCLKIVYSPELSTLTLGIPMVSPISGQIFLYLQNQDILKWGTPKSSISIGCSLINQAVLDIFWGSPI